MGALSICVLLVFMVSLSHEHGMLMDPVNRSSMWRLGYNTPPNYDDEGLFCGGINVQWDQNGGKCGLCGDNYADPRPRANENTGYYGKGIIVKKYKVGSTIKTVARITANHWGHFYYRLCPLKSKSQLETEECFAAHPLKIADGNDIYTLPSHDKKDFEVSIVLPKDVTCEQCVLEWTYVAGNNWGYCPDGTGRLGCGPQETFRTCSDISIY